MRATGFSIGVVILGAGASSRMGAPKLLLPWAGTTVLGHITKQWRLLGAEQIAAVVRSGDVEVEKEWLRLGNSLDARIVNERAEAGMFSSVQTASRWDGWKSGISHIVVALGDQPQISRDVLGSLVKFAAEFPTAIVQPELDGRPKHPVIFPRAIFSEVGASSAFTLRGFLEEHRAHRRFMVCDEPGLEVDLDTPEEYALALQRFAQRDTGVA